MEPLSIISTIRCKYLTSWINSLLIIKRLSDVNNNLLPIELIFSIMSMIWELIKEPKLDRYYCNKSQGWSSTNSNLTLGDIIDAISELGKVKILNYTSCDYKLYITFHKSIRCDSPSGMSLLKSELYQCPFTVDKSNQRYTLGSKSMYVNLHTNLGNIDNHLYDLLNKENPKLTKYFIKNNGSLNTWHRFNDAAHHPDSDIAKEVKRQIMILWLRDASHQILTRGLSLGKDYETKYQSRTIDEIRLHFGPCSIIY